MAEVPRCNNCGKSELWIMSPIRYVFFMSTLPIIAAILIGLAADPVFFLFIPAVILTNLVLAKRKTPMKICKNCKHTESEPSVLKKNNSNKSAS
ncbi:hypothetical protein ACE1TI_05545 [Alteribacillus sp. JSM 102045]|uniref:hypothetical protein n=1 Tax=Alteribacillus sp. JSM 102045 TaxID=1562101 RepID=UPI0035C033A4